MASNELVKQIIWWREEDAQSLSIRKKSEGKCNEQRVVHNRYFLHPEDKKVYFTYREMEIAMHLSEPLTYKTIGRMMDLSDRTIECHVRRMRIKLGCKDRFELIERIINLDVVVQFKKDYLREKNNCVSLYNSFHKGRE